MAIFVLSAKIISRAKGQSVIASAAYRAGEKLLDPNRIKDHDYTNRNGVEHTQIMAPDYAPDWVQVLDKSKENETRQLLWQRVEESERKKNSQLAREILIALPHELDKQQRIDLVRDFVERNFTSQGMVADVALHGPDRNSDPKNFHAHILLTMRDLTPDGFAPHKRRDWNDHAHTQAWREDWAHTANRHLERAGRSERIDHRSNKERGIEREPQPKLGPVAHEIEKSGRASHAGDDIRAVKERNLVREIYRLAARAIDDVQERLDQSEHPLAREAALSRLERLLDDLERKGGNSDRDRSNRTETRSNDPPKRDSRQTVDDRIGRLETLRAGLVRIGIDAEEAKRRNREARQREDDDRGRERRGDWWK